MEQTRGRQLIPPEFVPRRGSQVSDCWSSVGAKCRFGPEKRNKLRVDKSFLPSLFHLWLCAVASCAAGRSRAELGGARPGRASCDDPRRLAA